MVHDRDMGGEEVRDQVPMVRVLGRGEMCKRRAAVSTSVGCGSSGRRRVGGEIWVRSFIWQKGGRVLAGQERGLGRCPVQAGAKLGGVDLMPRHWEASEHGTEKA